MARKLFAVLLIFCFSLGLKAQDQLMIKVYNADNQSILTEVSMVLSDGTTIKSTNGILVFANNAYESFVFKAPGFQQLAVNKDFLIASGYNIFLRESVINLDEVVISASKFSELKKDVPQQIRTITSSEIGFNNQPTTAEMLQQSGSVFVQKSQLGGGSPIIRGFEANKVLIVVDGIRINNAIFRGGHLQNILRFDQNVLDRAEIVMGPGAVIYGSDALGGVMHLHTKKPKFATKDFEASGSSMFRYGSAMNEFTGNVQFNLASRKWASFTAITNSQFGDLIQGKSPVKGAGNWTKPFVVNHINGKDSVIANANIYSQSPTGYKQTDIIQKVSFKQNQYLQHDLNLQVSNTGIVNRYDRLSEISKGIPVVAEWYYGPEYRFLGAYTLNHQRKTKLTDNFRVIVSRQDVCESRNSRNFNASYLTQRNEKVGIYALNIDAEKQINGYEVRYGFEGFINDVQSTALAINVNTINTTKAASTRYPNNGSKYGALAAYTTITKELNERMVLTSGLRITQTNLSAKFSDTLFYKLPITEFTKSNTALNGNVGAVATIFNKTTVQANVATGFRVPNIDDFAKIFGSKINQVIIPNSMLIPEKTINTEIGINYQDEKRIAVSLNYWYTFLYDALALKPYQLNGSDSVAYDGVMSRVYAMQNSDRGFINGFNVNLKLILTPFLSFESQFSNTMGSITSSGISVPLDHIAPNFGKTSMLYRYKRVKTELFAMYNGAKKLKDYSPSGEDNIEYATVIGMPKWVTFNFRSQYNFNKNILARLAIENIFDKQYRTFGSGISAPGRNVILSVQANF